MYGAHHSVEYCYVVVVGSFGAVGDSLGAVGAESGSVVGGDVGYGHDSVAGGTGGGQ